jgi:hypothetical protein
LYHQEIWYGSSLDRTLEIPYEDGSGKIKGGKSNIFISKLRRDQETDLVNTHIYIISIYIIDRSMNIIVDGRSRRELDIDGHIEVQCQRIYLPEKTLTVQWHR